jgi:simple sugar transport system ATP-binding protein
MSALGSQAAPVPDREVPALELQHVTRRFGGLVACSDVGLTVMCGEIVALVGNNGAGKSTVLRIVCGADRPDDGEVLLLGRPTSLNSVREARAHGIEAVPQELALAPKLNVYSNMFLGRELLLGPRVFRFLARRKMEDEARRIIADLGVDMPRLRAKVGSLSGGQRQAVAVARAVGWGSSVVVLDEPTAALGVHETERVENTIRSMRENRLAVLLVSHDLNQVFRLADRVYVLNHGRIVGMERPTESTHERIVSLITGAAVSGGDAP